MFSRRALDAVRGSTWACDKFEWQISTARGERANFVVEAFFFVGSVCFVRHREMNSLVDVQGHSHRTRCIHPCWIGRHDSCLLLAG